MPVVQSWTSDEWKENLLRRFDAAKSKRALLEPQWIENQNTINHAQSRMMTQGSASISNMMDGLEGEDVDTGDSELGMNYAFKYLRFFHSQLSANPPAVVAMPASSDTRDRIKADAADRLVRWGLREKGMQETTDQMSLSMLVTGTGYTKIVWNKDLGEIVDFNEENNEVDLEGDIDCYSPDTWDVWIDPDARRKADVRYMFERITLPVDEAVFRFPDSKDLITTYVNEQDKDNNRWWSRRKDGIQADEKVSIIAYYEKGMPVNGMAGRHAFMLEDGTIIGKYGRNPHVNARLPYHIFTYIDISGEVYGKSIVEYVTRLQHMLNAIDSSTLDAVQAHNVVRMVLPSDMDVEDAALSTSSWDYIKTSGQGDIKYIPAPSLMADSWRLRDAIVLGIQELFGINDSMLGIQRREQSAVSQQTSIETGTMIHRRLYKKYELVVESIYKDFLGLIRKHWSEPRTVLVLGKEKAFSAIALKGADIAGGFDLDVQYGASLPLDPNQRREALLLMKDLLMEAGLSAKQVLSRMKLNDIEGIYDRSEMSQDRQREIFEEMIAKFDAGMPEYIAPEEMEDHVSRLEYAYDFLESSAFKYLDNDIKSLIKRHVKEREEMAAAQAAPGEDPMQQQPGQAPDIAGMPGVGGAMAPDLQAAPLPAEDEIFG